jgi:cell wall assembly regulator SMI1
MQIKTEMQGGGNLSGFFLRERVLELETDGPALAAGPHRPNANASRFRLQQSPSELWDRYEAVLARCAPAELAGLRPSATSRQIAEAEAAIKIKFPDELRYAYLRHNGSAFNVSPTEGGGSPLFSGQSWCSLDEVVKYWEMQSRVADSLAADPDTPVEIREELRPGWSELAIRDVWFHKKWIPIGTDGNPTMYVDMAPGPKGHAGQILYDVGNRSAKLIAPSLFEWIAFITRHFESGRLVISETTGGWHDTLHNQRFQYRLLPYEDEAAT